MCILGDYAIAVCNNDDGEWVAVSFDLEEDDPVFIEAKKLENL